MKLQREDKNYQVKAEAILAANERAVRKSGQVWRKHIAIVKKLMLGHENLSLVKPAV